MASSNTTSRRPPVFNHEGIRAFQGTPLQELRRSVLTALLWEDTFYETGAAHAKRTAELIKQCKPEDVAALAIEAREQMHLRHAPLALVYELTRQKGNGPLVAATLARVIQRPDELTEYVSLYYRDGLVGQRVLKPGTQRTGGTSTKQKIGGSWVGVKGLVSHPSIAPLSSGSKRGLAQAFAKFNRYSLAKYRGDDKAVKLADVLRLARPKPENQDQATLWKELRQGTLTSFDTWETELSAGKDKKAVFERLLQEGKLGGLAFLRNLRNMSQAGVSLDLIRERFKGNFDRVLPFRFISAARHAHGLASEISDAMLRTIPESGTPRLTGKTIILVDVSPSMAHQVSEKSEITRMDAGAGLAVLLREVCDECRVFAFAASIGEVKSYRGLPLSDGILKAVPSDGTLLGKALKHVNQFSHDRLIVVTDEESQDAVGEPNADRAYMINLATYAHGVGGSGKWLRITGWSERIVDYIAAMERELGVQP